MLTVQGLGRPGLDPVDFELADAECAVVRGDSGAGKTLLLRAIADLDPNRGAVSLDGTARDAMTGPDWRRKVVYVPAESGWWADTVVEHFAEWLRAEPVVARLALPSEVRDWDVSRLSTGERQRLAFARAITLDPPPRVLLLDESTSGLDTRATRAVEALVADHLGAGGSALWVTHDDQQSHRVGHRALRVDHGRVAETAL